MVARSHPVVWSLALRPDDAKQDPVVYGAEFGVVILAGGPRTASIQEGLDCLGLDHSGLEGERYFRLVVELTLHSHQSHSWSAAQGKENKRENLAHPHAARSGKIK